MSYDVLFYRKKDNAITDDKIAAYLNNNLEFNTGDGETRWVYDNPETGVYFMINRHQPDGDNDELYEEGFEDFVELNYSFEINYFRPDYFGEESFPFVEKFTAELDLYVLDPQEPDGAPAKLIPGKIKDNWKELNAKWILNPSADFPTKYLPLDKSDYLWRYQSRKKELEKNLSKDLFVPNIMVFEKRDGASLITLCVWPDHLPIILPKVDYLILHQEYKSLFKKVDRSGIVTYDSIMSTFGDAFEDVEYYGKALKVLKPKVAESLVKRYNKLRFQEPLEGFGTRMALDSFVNYKL